MDEDALQRSLRSRPPADPQNRPRLTDSRVTIALPGSTRQDRVAAHRPTLRARAQAMNAMLKLTAVAVLALAVGIGVVQLRPSTEQVGMAPAPSPSPSPLVWTPASIEQDWPAPVREEPLGDPVLISIADGYLDPQGDIESPDMPWIDILRVRTGDTGAQVDFGGALPSEFVVPGDPWIAYGLVFDIDLDGVADVRLGMDRVPAEPTPREGAPADTNDTDVRAWRTDFRTGVTAYGHAGSSIADGGIPEPADPEWFVQVLGASVTPPPETVTYNPMAKFYPYNDGTPYGFGEIPGPFYAWASVIQDGRVVATDYAPDSGWLDNTVKPGPTPEPGESPTP